LSLNELASRYETLSGQLSEQYYNQYAGLTYDRELMKRLAQQLTVVSKEFLERFAEPRSMYLASVDTIADAERLDVELDFHDQRMERISTDQHSLNGKKVNWGNWRQFNAQTDDAERRKAVFDEFLAKAPTISPLVAKRMELSREVYRRYDLTPLDSYLELEQTTYDALSQLLENLGEGAKQTYLTAANHFASQVLQKATVEYYDDFYTWRGRIYKPLNKYLDGKNPLAEIKRFLSNLRFDPSTIKVDAEDRPNKSPSASCWGIQVPSDVRILYRQVSPFTDFGSLFHEFGHGIHGTSANPEDSVWKRYIVPMSVAETFSMLIESVTENPVFLRQELKLEDAAVKEIVDRVRFMNLAFLTFYAANSLMKLEFWKRGYDVEQAANRWQELTNRFFIETPGNYWILHHIMPNYDMYSPSYVVAAVRVATLKATLIEDHGEAWWRAPQAGEFIRQLAQTRGAFDIKTCKLNPDAYLDEQTSLSFLR
jgi:oligoendopeptidase F